MEDLKDRGGPLSGIKVLELGTMIAGPVTATLLADFGAEVVKVEPPGTGDPIRHSGPFDGEESLYWNVEGRSKKSITLDLRTPEGQDILRKLAAKFDVVVENFRPGTLAKWGLDYDRLREANPRLVMASISGFGQTGPKSSLPAYDRVSLAFAGFLNMTGYPDRPPVRPGTAMADYQSALFAAFAVMLALYERDAKNGGGQHIDISLFESIFRFTDVMITAFDRLGHERNRNGNRHFAASPGDHYVTSDDQYIAMTVAANNVFVRLCEAIGRPELASDPRYISHIKRLENYDEINGIVISWMSERTADKISRVLEEFGVPFSKIYTPADIMADPHYAARGSIAEVEHPTLGTLRMPGVLPRFVGRDAPAIHPAPALGANTGEVLEDLLGLTASRIDELRAAGTI